MKKRLLSAFLALAMVLTLLPVSVFAEPAPDENSGVSTQADEATAAEGKVTFAWPNGTTFSDGDKVTITSSNGSVSLDLEFTLGSNTWTLSGEKTAPTGYTATLDNDATTLTLTASDAGKKNITDQPFGTVAVSATANSSTVNPSGDVTVTFTDGTDASDGGTDPGTGGGTGGTDPQPGDIDGRPASGTTGTLVANTHNGVSVQRCTQGDGTREYGKWYYAERSGSTTTYYEAENGIIVGNAWYPSPDAYAATNTGRGKYPSNFIIAGQGTASVNDAGKWPSTMTVELDGGTLTMPSNLNGANPAVTSLTVTDNVLYNGGKNGTVNGGIARTGANNSQFTLRLTNAEVTGSINLSGCRNSVTIMGGKVTGGVSLDGKYTSSNGQVTYNSQSLSFNSENGITSSSYTDVGGAISVTNANTSTIALHNVTGQKDVTYTGNQGQITVSGNSNLGALSYSTLATSTNKNVSPATVNIKGGRLTGITSGSGDVAEGRATLTINNAQVNGAIKMAGACDYNVTIGAGTTQSSGSITVPKGTLQLSGTVGASTKVGDIAIGNTGAKATLKVTGEKVSGGNITSDSGTLLTVDIPRTGRPSDHAYTFGTLNLGSYAGHGIAGGTFDTRIDTSAKKQWMNADLTFAVNLTGSKWTYYGSKELNDVFSDLGRTDAATDEKVYLAGQCEGTSKGHKITLNNGKTPWGIVRYSDGCTFLLPTMMFGTPVTEWTFVTPVSSGTGIVGAVVKDNLLTTPSRGGELSLTNKASVDIATGIRKVESKPEGVKTVLKGNVITLSGAVRDNGSGTSRIFVTLETNVRNETNDPADPQGDYNTVEVEVAYDTRTKRTYFVTAQTTAADNLGIKVEEDRLTMNDGKVVYTLDGSGLSVPAANLDIYATSSEVQVAVSKNNMTNAAKQDLINRVLQNGTKFEWNNAYAVWEGVNAALKSYSSESTVTGWVNNAQSTIWRSGLKDPVTGAWVKLSNGVLLAPHSGNFNATDGAEGTAIASAFSKAWLVPYLQINITDFTSDLSSITANLVPSYRIVVSQEVYVLGSSVEYVVSGQTGKSLGTLTGSMAGGATLTFGSKFDFNFAHQDATYGYDMQGGQTLKIDHVGAKDGLGTFVFNSTKSLIKLTHKSGAYNASNSTLNAAEDHYYDTLQAAVNDTLPQKENQSLEDAIVVDGAYKGSMAISVSGLARTFKVQVLGEKRLEVPSSSLIKSTVNVDTWTVQLLESTVRTDIGNITITEVTGGTARVSSNPAAEGQTVTITLAPAAGYVSNGVVVRTAAGTAVTVSGSGNVYTFVMPATSVTVTPSFVTGTGVTAPTNATVTVSSTNMGGATTTAMTGNVTGGSVVGVTTYPNTGYRTMGVNISTNGGSTTATRTGTNNFSFTVPVNATNVTVTPVYDVDNGTLFEDVWSTSYYSDAVSWAVGKGIIGGQSTYSFGSNYNCKRADMVVMLWRAAGSPIVSNVRNPFVDISPSDYYYNAVMWAYSKGITGGVDTTHFGPSQSVSRAQTVTFLYRYAGEPAVGTNSGFYDVPSNQYYAKAVTWAKNLGITGGKTLTSFAPNSNCLRAEIATFLYRDFTGTRA